MTVELAPAIPAQEISSPSERTFPAKHQVGLALILGACFLVGLAPRLDTDLWWHLRDGAYMWQHLAFPRTDPFSFTFHGAPWEDHSWLSELLFFGLYQLGGLWGPLVFCAFVIMATFGLVYVRLAQLGVYRMLALFVVLAALVSCGSILGARPQTLTLLFTAVFAVLLEKYAAHRSRWILYALPAIALLWGNLHAGALNVVLLVGLTLAGEWMNRLAGRPGALDRQDLQRLALAAVASAVATEISPNGINSLLYTVYFALGNGYSGSINEWASPDFHQLPMMVFEGMLLTLVVALFVRHRRVNWTHVLMTAVFTYLALSAVRNVGLWAVVVSPIVGLAVQDALPERWGLAARASAPPRRLPRREVTVNYVLIVACALLYVVEASRFVSPTALVRSESAQFPRGAAAYMMSHQLPPNTYSAYAWGGYVDWKLYPRYRDFIDGRADTVFSITLLRDYFTIDDASVGWQRAMGRWHVQNVLVPPNAPIAVTLAHTSGWKRVYGDRTAVLYTLSRGSA